MNRKSLIHTALVLCARVAVSSEISFTGGTSNDLSLPENWNGGALPTSSDVGVIDAGGGSSAAYTLSANVSFGGLRIANAAATTTFSGAQLTLGSSGLTVDTTSTAADVVRFDNSFATTCDQTWNFGNVVRTRLNAAITGTHVLTLTASASSYLLFDKAPAYGGTISMTKFLQVHAYDAGTYAQDVDFSELNGRAEFMLTNEIAFATLFPGRVGAWDAEVLWKHHEYPAEGYSDDGQYVTLNIADGDAMSVTAGHPLVLDAGTFKMTGGSVTAPAKFSLGYSNKSALLDMSGGTFDANYMTVASRAIGNTHEFRLSGGTATVATTLHLGYDGGSLWGNALLSVSGGTLNVNGASRDEGIVLETMSTANATTHPPNAKVAVSGGRVCTPQVAFGYPGDYETAYQINSNGWCELSLSGGTLEIGKYGLRLGSRWNAATDTNASVRARLTGGTLAASAPFDSTVPLTLPASATPVTVDTGANFVTLAAPVAGEGTLKKTGEGTLAISDAAPFVGSLDVAEGTVRLVGSAGADIAADDCYRWTGDGAAAGKAANEAVLSWADVNHGVTATYASTGGRAAKGVFNGHDGVAFAGTQLEIPAAVNPIAGETNFSAVLVFRLDKQPVSTGDNWYQMTQLLGWEQSGVANDWGLCANNAWRLCGGFGMAGWQDHSFLSSADRIIEDGRAHVAIVTWHNGDQIIHLDGYETTNTLSLTTPYPRGNYNFRFAGINVKGSYAEVRLYKDRLLTLAERQSIGRALLRTYGGYDATAAYEKNDPAAEESIDDQYAAAAAYADDAIAVWSADSLADATEKGAGVSAWPASVGDYSATLLSGRAAPTFVPNALNGHAALEFSHDRNTVLGVASENSPFVGLTDFTIAVVIRTSHTDLPDVSHFFQMAGIIGNELSNFYRGDFGIGLVKDGYPMAGSGQLGGHDFTVGKKENRPFALADGLPHVIVYSCKVAATPYSYLASVDGVNQTMSITSANTPLAIESSVVQIGSANSNYRFTGELAEIRVYDKALDGSEVKALARACCAKYGIVPLAVTAGDYGAAGRSGLGATNVTVAAGATLALPRSATKPYTLKEGVAFNCLGSVTGSLRVGSGATLDLAENPPAALDDLQLADGATLAVDAANPRTVASFEAAGAVTIDIENPPSPLTRRIPILSYTDSADVSEATLAMSAAFDGYQLSVNQKSKTVELFKRGGVLFTVR